MAESPRTPTLKDVAADAGIHVATASRALSTSHRHLVNEETRKRVAASAERLGYRVNTVARSLRSGRTGTLGVVVADLGNPFTATLLRGIDSIVEPSGQLSVVMETHDSDETLRRAVERLTQNRVDAIIVSASHLDDGAFLEAVADSTPVIVAVRRASNPDDPDAVGTLPESLQDDVSGAAAAAEHLLSHGHRRIAQIAGDQSNSSFRDRGLGFRREISRHSSATLIELDEHATDSTVEEGSRLASKLLAMPEAERPTAIFAHNDMLAVGALDALKDAGLSCPGDVSVIGYNDAPLIDHMTPPLTTVKLPAFDIGRHAARLALEHIDGTAADAERVMLAPELVTRDSVAAAR